MTKSQRILLFTASGVVLLLALSAVALAIFADATAYKPRLESIASKVLGLEVSIGGSVGIDLFPGLGITLDDVHIRNQERDIGSAKKAHLGIELFPLFHREVRVKTINLHQPMISIERDLAGRLNIENPQGLPSTMHAPGRVKVSLSDATFRYANKRSGTEYHASDCRLELRTRRTSQQSPGQIKNVSFVAELNCATARRNDIVVSDLKLLADGKSGIIELKPVSMRLFGAQGSGRILADITGDIPHYHVHYALPQFRIEEFFKTVSPQKGPEGTMDFLANLTMQGKNPAVMRQTVNGEFSLRGDNLMIIGSDLDETFARFESSQHFNLVDLGAFFFAGPVGVVVTKGFDFANILQGGGQTRIRKLVSEWEIKRGVAQALDVAMATDKNRIALQGRLNFVSEKFDDVTVALVDSRGCAKVKQTIRGSFHEPEIEKPNIFRSLSGPVRELLKEIMEPFNGEECDVYYAGSVTPPT